VQGVQISAIVFGAGFMTATITLRDGRQSAISFSSFEALLRSALERTKPNKVGIEEDLSDHEAPTRFQDPPQLSKSRLPVGDRAQDTHEVGTIKGAVAIRKPPCIALLRCDVRNVRLTRSPHDIIEHLLLNINDIESPIGSQGQSHRKGVDPDARPNLKYTFAAPWLKNPLKMPGRMVPPRHQ
jgi:hypothetical protein